MKKQVFYGMSNDYMFRAVLQKSSRVLKKLVAELLYMDPEDITTIRILNPIELGSALEEKDSILDIEALINEKEVINIELQIREQSYWCERSLLYWSRAYDHLEAGHDYGELRETIHIGILDFTLFPEHPEFYAEYRILNLKTHQPYTNKFCIRVLDLSMLGEISEEANPNLVKWAQIFKAHTMKELEMLAGKEDTLEEMVVTIKQLSEDEKIRQHLAAEAKFESDMRTDRRIAREQGIEKGKIEAIIMLGRKMKMDDKEILENLQDMMKVTMSEAEELLKSTQINK